MYRHLRQQMAEITANVRYLWPRYCTMIMLAQKISCCARTRRENPIHRLGSESAFAACGPNVRYADGHFPSNMNWPQAEEPIRLRRFRSVSNHRSRFPASVPLSDPAGFPIPAWAHGRPTSPHASLSSSDTPNPPRCSHRSRSDWQSRRLHHYHRPLFTDFPHFGAAIAASCSQASPAQHDAIGGYWLTALP